MTSRSEVGHAKNVANLQKLTEKVTVYTRYNPPIDKITIDSLRSLYTASFTKLNEVEEKRRTNKTAITLRQSAFAELKPICTRIINFLEILGLPAGTLNQAKSLNRLIQGRTKKTATTSEENGASPKIISTSRQSYTQQTDNFGILLQLLATLPDYNPNEEDLSLTNLTAYQNTLLSTTQAVDQTEAQLNSKFIERDKILYTPETGLYDIVQYVKKYVKSVYGPVAPEYANISTIRFTRQR